MTWTLGEKEVRSEREFDAARERVCEAWTNPDRLARWWGPAGFTNVFHEFDLRPGGDWRFIMRGPDGKEYRNHVVFVEIAPPERIVLDHVNGHRFRVTATFEETDGRTKLTFLQQFEKKSAFEKVISFVPEANEQNFDRLGALLAEGSE